MALVNSRPTVVFKNFHFTPQALRTVCAVMEINPDCFFVDIAADEGVQLSVSAAVQRISTDLVVGIEDSPSEGASDGPELQTQLCSFDSSSNSESGLMEEEDEQMVSFPVLGRTQRSVQQTTTTTTTTETGDHFGLFDMIKKEFDAAGNYQTLNQRSRHSEPQGCLRSRSASRSIDTVWDKFLRDSSPSLFSFPRLGFDPSHIYSRSFYFSRFAPPLAYHAFSQPKDKPLPCAPVDEEEEVSTSPTVPCAGIPGVVDDENDNLQQPLLVMGVVALLSFTVIYYCWKDRFYEILKTSLGKKLYNLVSVLSRGLMTNVVENCTHSART
eukprot:CAMPEP_0174261556 /NCGR_PEP_ID=MMETSP0439-20130205/11497_1 /TAXON_ID=0 /ORGANISM="Stereomyxa ramosa, Strain Chinc5" /LENGTH=325 /DNA_ID=CAMNT_0015346045 /DNA_START=51 /DNA_END=1028 /DNA_ORIENTATION=+